MGRGSSGHGVARVLRWATVTWLLCGYALGAPQSAKAQSENVRRILIVNEAGVSYPAIDIINQGIRREFENSPYKIEIYAEYLETVLFSDPIAQQEVRAFILHKYQNRKIDVIITVGPSALQFLRDAHKTAFDGIPIVFCLPTGSVPGSPMLDSDFTGVENDMAAGTTVEAALRLQPNTGHVFVVGGQSNFDKQLQVAVREQLKGFESHVDIVYLTSLAMPDLLERLRHLPPGSVVLLTTVAQDAAGQRFKSNETGPLVAAAANAPVFSLFDGYLNHGEVGGDLSSFREQGRIAGSMALRILHGEKPQNIPRVKDVTTYMFDARALERWGFKERNLPVGSLLINRQPTFWEMNKQYLIPAAVALLAQSFVILGLLWQRAKRRKTETKLVASNERLRLASEELHEVDDRLQAVVTSAMDAIVAVNQDEKIVVFNAAAERMFGCTSEKAIGTGIDRLIPHCFQLSQKQSLNDTGQVLTAEDSIDGSNILWGIRNNGERFPIEASVAQVEARGKKLFTVIIRDVTERKQAEEAMLTVSRRLIEAHEEERTWLARELHDDVNQRLALMAVNLDVLRREVPESAGDVWPRLNELREQIKDLGIDVQSLSHRLHSSKLKYLGLTSAATAFCREFSERKQVQIDLHCDSIPKTVSEEISLSLFRVLQEALQNASKHSGSEHYQVSIRYAANEIALLVSDRGVGFDPQQALLGRGLGITSMRERLKLVDGELTIDSASDTGTVVRARVPLHQAAESASAAKT